MTTEESIKFIECYICKQEIDVSIKDSFESLVVCFHCNSLQHMECTACYARLKELKQQKCPSNLLLELGFIRNRLQELNDYIKNKRLISNKKNELRNTLTKKLKQQIKERDGNKCVYCGSNELLEVDHIIPISGKGNNDPLNLQTLCHKCNQLKDNKILVELINNNNEVC